MLREMEQLHFCLRQGWIRWTYTLKFHTWVGVIPGVHQFLPGAWEDPLLALPPQNNDGGTSQLTNWNARFPVETRDLMARYVWYFLLWNLSHLIISRTFKKSFAKKQDDIFIHCKQLQCIGALVHNVFFVQFFCPSTERGGTYRKIWHL